MNRPIITSRILLVASTAREAIYDMLLQDPHARWTVSKLSDALPALSTEALRTTVYLLMGDRLVDPMPGHRALTVTLAEGAGYQLARIVADWRAARERPNSKQHGGNADATAMA